MNNIIKDVSTLTTIPELNLTKLFNIINKCISHDIVECLKNNEDVCIEDIGIGNLVINLDSDELKFKFIPSQQLQTTVLNSIRYGESELVIEVEQLLKDKIINTYKSLL